MRKVAMYRRGRGGINDGLKERIIWQLSTRPMSERELSIALNEPRYRIRHNIRDHALSKCKVATITAGEWFTYDSGERDRVYTLESKARRVAPAVNKRKDIVVSINSLRESGEDKRQKCIEAAARRSRLIKAGLWITSSDIS